MPRRPGILQNRMEKQIQHEREAGGVMGSINLKPKALQPISGLRVYLGWRTGKETGNYQVIWNL